VRIKQVSWFASSFIDHDVHSTERFWHILNTIQILASKPPFYKINGFFIISDFLCPVITSPCPSLSLLIAFYCCLPQDAFTFMNVKCTAAGSVARKN
jgi:hypothetical protein